MHKLFKKNDENVSIKFIVSMVLLLLIIVILYFCMRSYSTDFIVSDGYMVRNSDIDDVLLDKELSYKEDNQDLQKVSTDDSIYKSLNKYYISKENSDKRSEVNVIYPIYTNNGNALVNLDENSKLITKYFEVQSNIVNSTITDGHLFNYSDGSQADTNDYIFLSLSNNTYINLDNITFDTKVIPKHSILNFHENYINYYYYNNGVMVYDYIDSLETTTMLNIGEPYYLYGYLLYKLGISDSYNKANDISVEKPVNVEKPEYVIKKTTKEEEKEEKVEEGKWVWIKPEVSAENFKVNVYSGTSSLSIYDPAGVIIGSVSFEFRVNDKIFMRKSFVSSGDFEITGLLPDTTFEIIGSYKFYDKEEKKIEKQFFKQTVKTKDLSTLDPIELSYETGDVYPKQIEIKNLKIKSSLDSEILKGVKKTTIQANNTNLYLSSTILNKMYNGESVTYLSPDSLSSNTTYNYKFIFTDVAGNTLPCKQPKGVAKTSKQPPTASLKVSESDIDKTVLSISLNNKDNVDLNNYRIEVYNESNVNVHTGSLNNSNSQTVTINRLNPNSLYNVKILANYNLGDGKGLRKDQVIGQGKFTTMTLAGLGYFRVSNSVENITSTSASIRTSINTKSTNAKLLGLLDSFTIQVLDKNKNVLYTKKYSGNDVYNLTIGEEVSDSIENLSSRNEYTINYIAVVKQGSAEESINVLSSVSTFNTMKTSAHIRTTNSFVNSSMIDFDVSVVDVDESIRSDRVILEVRDTSEKLVFKKYLNVNDEPVNISLTDLNASSYYSFNYVVEEYNEGYDNSSFHDNYSLELRNIFTKEGVTGKLTFNNLLRQIDGNNLFNINDYDRIRIDGNTASREYNLANNEVMFSAKNGYVSYGYYLPEAHGTKVKISFYAKYDKETKSKAPAYIGINYGDRTDYALTGLNDEYKFYSFEFNMVNNYIGFNIKETSARNLKTKVWFKDIMIQTVDVSVKATRDVNYSYSNTGYKFTNTEMFSGDEPMPSPTGSGVIVGNYGHGHARITNLDNGNVINYKYTGNYQQFVPSVAGKYKIELWGAAGGDGYTTIDSSGNSNAGYDQTLSSHGGRGAYTSGVINLKTTDKFYIYVGGSGVTGVGTNHFSGPKGGWNGGGDGSNRNSGSGGGATDVRVVSGNWNDTASLQSRIMVAGAGGGTDDAVGTLKGTNDGSGGAGGGLKAVGAFINGTLNISYYATQVSGGGFGIGASPTSNTDTGGAGGGYYGGMVTNNSAGGASGGSSYISGHLGCVAYDKNSRIEVPYEDYKEDKNYMATVYASLYDRLEEIQNGQYYIKVYKNGEYQKTYDYTLNNHIEENSMKNFELERNKNYKLFLTIKIGEKYYNIDELEINTYSEVRTISTIPEFFNMHPNGKYIVLNDLDFTNVSGSYSAYFYGSVDFQGYKVKINTASSRTSYLFHTIRSSGILKNLNLEVTMDNAGSRNDYYGIAYINYGMIDNLYIHIMPGAVSAPYVSSCLGVANHYGTIKNFVVNMEGAFSARRSAGPLFINNYGVVKNGYVYGKNVISYYDMEPQGTPGNNKNVGALGANSAAGSTISNVYVLSMVNMNNTTGNVRDQYVGNFLGTSSSVKIFNSYSVELDDGRDNTNLLNADPNDAKGSVTSSDLYYISEKDRTYSTTKSMKTALSSLTNVSFQNKILNSSVDNPFNVDDFVSLGYFPQLRLNDSMPKQDWIELPKVPANARTLDVISSKSIESDTDKATVEIYLNNKNADKILNIEFYNINSSSVVEGSQKDLNGNTTIKLKLAEPTAYKSVYYVKKVSYKTRNGYEDSVGYENNERAVYVDLYKPVATLDDFKEIKSDPSINYALINDLDFEGKDMSVYLSTTAFTGKFNGNFHTMSNINLTATNLNGVFHSLSGTVQNLYVRNYQKSYNNERGGFVGTANANSVINNVHVIDANIKAYSFVGGLVGYASNCTIKNSSSTNFVSSTNPNLVDVRLGGLVGYGTSVNIYNSFVQNVDIEITDSISTYGVGGMIGQFASGYIQNVYATGKLRSNSSYTGGIVGFSSDSGIVSNAWTNVNIATELDHVGGIVGRTANQNVSKTLVLGAIFSNYSGENIHRTTGNALTTPQRTYAWDKQRYYGEVTGDASSDLLISADDIFSLETYEDLIDLGDGFNYESLKDRYLPKLNDYDTGELLVNQKNNTMEDEMFNVSDISSNAGADSATLRFNLSNPNNYEVTNVKFDNLEINDRRTSISTENGVTSVYVEVTPTKYYDRYALTDVYYIDQDGDEKVYDKYSKIDLKFYKILSSYQDWQGISTRYAENYRLTNDIDFAGRSLINTNVKIGRLEGQDNGHTIKNINLTTSTNNFALIRVLTTELKDVTFENINIQSSSSGNYVNLIQFNYGEIDNLNLTDIVINAPNNSYAAPIGNNRGANIAGVNLKGTSKDSYYIRGVSYVGGFIGESMNYSTASVDANQVTVYGSGTYVGGVIGYKAYSNPTIDFNYTATKMDVTGLKYVGGVFGIGGANQSSITDSKITGLSGGERIGGFAGHDYVRYMSYISGSGLTVNATNCNYVGGMIGRSGYDVSYSYIKDSTVKQTGTGKNSVGGFIGYTDSYTHSYNGVSGLTIENDGTKTGGYAGFDTWTTIRYSYVNSTTVRSTGNEVGGFLGAGGYYRLNNILTNAQVYGNSYVGGIVGNSPYIHELFDSYTSILHSAIVANSIVEGNTHVGGVSGITGSTNSAMAYYDKYLYNVITVANVTAKNTATGHAGIITGLDHLFTRSLSKVYAYNLNEYTTSNTTRNTADVISLDNSIPSGNTLTSADLGVQSGYTSRGITTTYFTFKDGYFPKVKNAAGTQKDIPVPSARVTYQSRLRTLGTEYESLIKYNIYPSSVNTINIDFDKTNDYTHIEIYENDKKVIDKIIDKRTMTFKYNYSSTLKIVITDGVNNSTKTYKAEDLINELSVYKNKYAYIYNHKLMGNVDKIDDKVLHIFEDKALLDNNDIYNIYSGKVVSHGNDLDFAEIDTIPLYTFKYNDSIINTYYDYSIVSTDNDDVIYDYMIIVKNGKLNIIDKDVQNKKDSIIIDSYSNNDYQTVLGLDGVIYNLKSSIKLPTNMTNKNIVNMSNNINSNTNLVEILYKNGKVIVFDYTTGEILNQSQATEHVSLFNYMKDTYSTSEQLIPTNNKSNYYSSIDFKDLLEKNPIINDNGKYISSTDNVDKTMAKDIKKNNEYITYYDSNSRDYKVMSVNTLLNSDKSINTNKANNSTNNNKVLTENDKVNSNVDLIKIYNNKSSIKYIFSIDSLYIFIGILISVVLSLLVWFINIRYLKNRS